MENLFNKIVTRLKYNNIIEASNLSIKVARLSGVSVSYVECTPNNQVVSKLSKIGMISYLIWSSSYFYCTWIAYVEDQSILRSIYKTKLKHYGDTFEWASCIVYVTYGMLKIPFILSKNTNLVQRIIDVDLLLINDLGRVINYNKNAFFLNAATIGQFGVYLIRFLCIWMILQKFNTDMPTEKIFQVICSDALALISTTYLGYYLIILKFRFEWISEVMSEIKTRKPWVFKVLVRHNANANTPEVGFQDRHICEKVKMCARVYGMLYETTGIVNKQYGDELLLTILNNLIVIILYMFYFMEATATGLFHDLQRYIVFLILFFWHIAYALTIMFVNIYFCESVIKEAAKVSFTTHEIINGDFGSEVATEAMQFSIQMLHQVPVFTACGLFKLNYELLQAGAQMVLTYLIMLLQFAINKD